MNRTPCPSDLTNNEWQLLEPLLLPPKILSSALTCPPCGARYPIAEGIPNLLPPELRNTPPA